MWKQALDLLLLGFAMLASANPKVEDYLADQYWAFLNAGAYASGLPTTETSGSYRIEQFHAGCPVGPYDCGACPTGGGAAVAISAFNDRVSEFCGWNQTRKIANAVYNQHLGVYKLYVAPSGGGSDSHVGCPPLLSAYQVAENGCRCVFDRFDPSCHP
jgi:hypothetical protein